MMGLHGTEIAWPAKPQDKKSRAHNHHISLRERIKEHQNRTQEKYPKSEGGVRETTKAAAWAVFQRHGGGGVGLSQTHGSAVRRPTRFKIEAQMRHEFARPSVSESAAASWDAGSTLFDSFELDSLLKTLDQAANSTGAALQQEQTDEEVRPVVVFPQKHWISRPNPSPSQRQSQEFQGQRSLPGQAAVDDGRLHTVDKRSPLKAADNNGPPPVGYKLVGNLILDELYNRGKEGTVSDPFAHFGHTPSPFNVRRMTRRSFDSSLQVKTEKGGSCDLNNRGRWKGLLHTLHLDSASGLFNRFHAQVAPHDSHKKLENKASRGRMKIEVAKAETPKANQTDDSYNPKQSIANASSADARFDPRFDPKNLHISKDVHPPADKGDQQRISWRIGLKAVFSRPFNRQGSLVSEKSDGTDSPKQVPVATLEFPRKSGSQRGPNPKEAKLHSVWSPLTARLQNHEDEQRARGQRHVAQTPPRRGSKSVIETVSLSHHEHHHHHHHHAPPAAADYEFTVQAISRRCSRWSFEEKTCKLSLEEGSMRAPSSSFATRSSGDPNAAFEERVRARLTSWEAELSLAKGSACVH